MHGVGIGPGFARVTVDQRKGAAVARVVVTNNEPPRCLFLEFISGGGLRGSVLWLRGLVQNKLDDQIDG